MTVNSNLSNICISPNSSMQHAIMCMNKSRKGIVVIVNDERKLLGTVNDGDIRRSVMNGKQLDTQVSEILGSKKAIYSVPIVAHIDADRNTLLQLLNKHSIRQIPLVDAEGHVVDLVTIDELVPTQNFPTQAVIMAGGMGKRLRPLTKSTPKPMLTIGDRPLLELIIDQLQESGIRQVSITTHYQSDKIIKYFGDGSDFGMKLNYVVEDSQLGTAGALRLVETNNEPVLIINGDIITSINFENMIRYHKEHKAIMTIGVREYDMNVPYGVVESEGVAVKGLVEKPIYKFYVNAGIYLIEPVIKNYIPINKHFDMTDLIKDLLGDGLSVVNFPILEYWLDIGQHTDYEQAKDDAKSGKFNNAFEKTDR
jgi:dTDP-glucose pyrophosphorylase